METYESAEYEFIEDLEDPTEEEIASSRNSNPRNSNEREQSATSDEFSGVFKIIHHRPLLFWGSVWVTLVVLSALSTLLLISPLLSKREAEPVASGVRLSPAAGEVTGSSETGESGDSVSWWALGTIAIGCATGSMLIARQLNRSQPIRRASSRPRSFVAQSRVTVVPKPATNLTVATHPKQNPHYGAEPTSAEPIVTVVPAHESTPLDWDEPSLADLMDVRRRRPLSSWF